MKLLKVLLAAAVLPILAFVLWTLLSGPTLAERGLALAIAERDMILEELPEPRVIRESATSARPCSWLRGCRNAEEADIASLGEPRRGATDFEFGPFEDLASINASTAQLVERLENVGYVFRCTYDPGAGRRTKTHHFRESSGTYAVTIFEPLHTDESVNLTLLATADPEGEPVLQLLPCEQ